MLIEISQSQKVEGSYVFSHMLKLGSNWDTRGTPNNGGETPVEPGRWSRGMGGRSMKKSLPLTLCTDVRIPMSISIPCMGEGEWGGN